MQSYNLENIEDDDPNQEYKQDLGLRKMLYKYQNENEQLKNQIRALTERLQGIMEAKNQTKAVPEQQIMTPHQKFWNDQMQFYYKRIEQLNSQIKASKQLIDIEKQQEYIHKANLLKEKDKKLAVLKLKLAKYQQQIQGQAISKVSTTKKLQKGEEISQEQLEQKLIIQLDEIKKRIRELQKTRNNNHKHDLNKHREMVNLSEKTRRISNQGIKQHFSPQERQSSPKKGGLWGMELTDQNYYKVKEQLEQLKKQKNMMMESIKVQNTNLRQKVSELKNQYIDLSTTSINNLSSLNLSNATNPKNTKQLAILSTPKRYPDLRESQTLVLPDIPLGNSAYERKNDKNYVQKQIKIVEWSGAQKNKIKRISSGLNWNDESKKSPITGINIWMDKYLVGVQFIHTLGQSTQHLHMEGNEGKKIVPIQYRLQGNDYLENVVLVINNGTNPKFEVPLNSIVGIQLSSKNGRKDHFGQKIGIQGTQKFNFDIKGPQKPIYSIGSFSINSSTQISCINKLGFAVI